MKRLLICGALLMALGGPARAEAPPATPDKASPPAASAPSASPTAQGTSAGKLDEGGRAAAGSSELGANEGAADAADKGAEAEAAPPPLPEPDMFQDDLDPDGLPRTGVAAAVGVFVKTLLALAFILLLAYLTLSKGVGKLVAKSQQGKNIRVVERIGLEQRRSLFLVEVEGRRLLIGTSEAGMTTLADLSGPVGAPRPFADVMQHTPSAPHGERSAPPNASAEPA